MIKDMNIQSFLDELAAKSSTPGGGGAAALSGAMGAALVSMVANFTVGKSGYESVDEEFKSILTTSEKLRTKLIQAIDDDAKVFNRVMAAYGMKKNTDNEKIARSDEIQAALKEATDVPLECAHLCQEIINLSLIAAKKGNMNVISDAGVAVLVAYAGLKSAALNVKINISGIKDHEFSNNRSKQLESLLENIETLKEDIYNIVKDKL